MTFQTEVRTTSTPVLVSAPVQNGLLQRKCDGEREKDKKKILRFQNQAIKESDSSAILPFVHDVPRLSGTSDFIETHDFSKVPVFNSGSPLIQTKLVVNKPGDEYEHEADRVADGVIRASDPIAPLVPSRRQAENKIQAREMHGIVPELTSNVETRINTLKGKGQPLSLPQRQFFEQRFGHDFSHVRVHTDDSAAKTAREVKAHAFTTGNDIVFAPGQYNPETTEGKRLIAHELTHVIQQGNASAQPANPDAVSTMAAHENVVQRANAADTRLPIDQVEAISYAVSAKTEIDAANTRLATATDPSQRNVPLLVAQEGITLAALTPRHDSAAPPGRINFFAGQANYTDSVELSERTTHHINSARDAVRIRGRQHANVDNLLTGPEIEERLVQAVSEVAHTRAARKGAPAQLDLYRAQFNASWNVAPFAAMSASFDATLSSKGPRTPRARAIFDRIYADDVALKTAYDANTGGIRERIDAYTGPEGMNPINSPRLQRLRAAFFPLPMPVPNASYVAFRTAVQTAAAGLEPADRDVVDSSNDWQRLINQHVTSEDRRAEIRTIIRTPPPPPPPPPAAAPAAAPAPAAPGGAVTPQMFVDGIRIDGPTAPVIANQRRERVTLTPRSGAANPAVAIDSRFTVTPAARVQGNNVSLASAWPNGATAGTPFEPEIINTSTIGMTAHLDMVNGPAGLAPSPPIPDLSFTVQDNRQTDFIANWFAAVSFNNGARQERFVPASTPRYRGGTQNFRVGGSLPDPRTNPGLTLFVRTRIKRGAAIIFPSSPLTPFPPDASSITPIAINIPAPAVVPVTGDPLDFEVELIGADRVTVLDTKIISMRIFPEATYTRAQAIAAAVADDTHFHDNTPAGLLGQMTALGGIPAAVAAAINAPLPAPRLTLRPLTVRHDSTAYVSAVTGGPNPSQVGYFVGTTYNNAPPDAAHSFADVAGAAAFFIPSGFGPRFVVANRTTDVAAGTRRPDPNLIRLIVHEAVHAMDVRPAAGTPIEGYKTEFRAYWMDGRFGPPNQGICPPPFAPFTTICPPAGAPCFDATYRSELPPPGPKSCRARKIFGNLYGSTTYPCVKPSYDNNIGYSWSTAANNCIKVAGTEGFREAVDNYLIPDGINLIVSVRLESLRQLIESFSGIGFTAFRTSVQGFMGVGPPPPVGALNADEQNEVQRNRAWRDLVNRKITNAANRALIKTDLGVPA